MSTYNKPRIFINIRYLRGYWYMMGRTRQDKYGEGTYRDAKALELWKQNRKRLRAKFIRRALPILEKLWL